ncbi:hypothetical protein FHS16_005112 [Paenibacillus endophyticus]|uniref:Uncharacterized protein n=1 Tax=Paenibacillus endophyticus TaxID=1294268 RepID=A0A7W5CC68_9BACL|nr:hypothetical protein [Paenibacillus endophyticus]MBB3155013.1 hypothetical protein [Paenibacillus endophyticus]
MSAYEQYAEEKRKIDAYLNQQYVIAGVREGLSGDWLELKHPEGDQVSLLVETADARKYFVNMLLKQARPT